MSHDVKNPGAAHGSSKQYTVGFILSIILTIIPFGMVMSGMTGGVVLFTIAITAFAQVLVQLIYFLHLNGSEEQRWDTIAFIYTVLTIAILFVGSIWIMNYLHANMMI
ncbi:cytochrome o ubiquinol oxidase subunit IV [Acinetobacter qingfengensis]|uniref:Cytochrome bo(3) ubiquinol oxidase subunit 4 n=1 Tax=Acinetobacter qingfengensis TaxID=1262585 RepID=A0A1E7RDW4_9GAMM|nr:cytochrome o ubiquinol oxidase subunit IV [Acinetobacter qingfengensis]KAA8735309.1 cytochrome o ubiquinol oxidase subunit IV [Acinetobacter qingfengensis]OEY97427.1 cytochrome o ubiquinol oxidase subunit IV [Acinetobacter qingfengensis]